MVEASRHCVDIAELQAAASRIIAERPGRRLGWSPRAPRRVDARHRGMRHRLDPGKMNRLPNTAGMKDEVIVARSQRISTTCGRARGVRLVEIGIADRFSGAGCVIARPGRSPTRSAADRRDLMSQWSGRARPCRRSSPWACARRARPRRRRGAIAPAGNLRRFIAEGADLVVFSGGKALRGPQSRGYCAVGAT